MRLKTVSYDHAKLLVEVELNSRPEADMLLQRLKSAGVVAALDAINPKGKGVEARFALSAQSDP